MTITRRKPVSKWSDYPRWMQALALIAILNFASFFMIALRIGGDAWNGCRKNGSFFLGSHGKYTAVSEALWTYSYYHVLSVWITHGSVFLGVSLVAIRKKKQSLAGDIC